MSGIRHDKKPEQKLWQTGLRFFPIWRWFRFGLIYLQSKCLEKEHPWLSYIGQPLFHLIVFSSLFQCHCLAFVPIGVRQYEATAIFSWCNNPRPIRIEQDIRAIIKSSSPGTSVGCPFDNVINVINVTQKPLMDVILWGMADSKTTSTSKLNFFGQTLYRMQEELKCLDDGACSWAKSSSWNATSSWANLLCWLRPVKNTLRVNTWRFSSQIPKTEKYFWWWTVLQSF